MLDICKLKMVKEIIDSLELIIEKKVRVGSSHFFLSVTVIPTHSFYGANNGHR